MGFNSGLKGLMGYKFMITYVFLLELPPIPTRLLHPPSDKPISWQALSLQQHACRPISVLWAVLCHVDGARKTAVHQISKENAVTLSPKFVFLFACTHLYSHVSLYPSVIVTHIRTCTNVNLRPLIFFWRNACRRSYYYKQLSNKIRVIQCS
jgi:hypothetical protein